MFSDHGVEPRSDRLFLEDVLARTRDEPVGVAWIEPAPALPSVPAAPGLRDEVQTELAPQGVGDLAGLVEDARLLGVAR